MSGWFEAVAAAWWSWTWGALWQSSLLIVLVAALDRLLRRRAWPQLLHALWLLAAAKLVLPPTLASPVGLASLLGRGSGEGSARVAGLAPEAAGAPASLATVAFLAWLGGLAILAGIGLLRWRREARRIDASSRPAHPETLAVFSRAAARLGLRRAPRLVLVDSLPGPAVFRPWRPMVLLPAELPPRLSPVELEHVLLHELAHVRRGDLWLQAALGTLHLVYWFHPPVIVLRRRAHALREVCCDLTVAARLGDARAYRGTLLRLAGSTHFQPISGASALTGALTGFLVRRSTLLDRLRALEGRGRWRRLRLPVTAAIVVGVAACLIPMAATSAARIGPQPPAELAAEIEQARKAVVAAANDAPGTGSLHLRHAVLYLESLERQAGTAGAAPGSDIFPSTDPRPRGSRRPAP